MKKVLSLIMIALMFISVCSCGKKEVSEWDMTALPEPTEVESFDVAVMVQMGDPGDLSSDKTYFNGEVYSTQWHRYMGSYNDRHYFYSRQEGYDDFCIFSCNDKYEDYRREIDITKQMTCYATLYKGAFYATLDKKLYSYNIDTKEKKLILENAGAIIGICDDWIITGDENEFVSYCIKTGETVRKNCDSDIVGLCVDKKIFGSIFELVDDGNEYYNKLVSDSVMCADPFSGEVSKMQPTTEYHPSNAMMMDDNGDIWLRVYNKNSPDLPYSNFTLRKIYDAKSSDTAHNEYYDEIIDGWYYYRYSTQKDDFEGKLARLNLKTGEHQYCPNIDVSGYYELSPYFFGSGKEYLE